MNQQPTQERERGLVAHGAPVGGHGLHSHGPISTKDCQYGRHPRVAAEAPEGVHQHLARLAVAPGGRQRQKVIEMPKF